MTRQLSQGTRLAFPSRSCVVQSALLHDPAVTQKEGGSLRCCGTALWEAGQECPECRGDRLLLLLSSALSFPPSMAAHRLLVPSFPSLLSSG